MATAAEKEALGLSPDASDQDVQDAIASLRAAAEAAAPKAPEGPVEAVLPKGHFKIKHLRFEYRVSVPDAGKPGERMFATREAKQGEVVEITQDDDVERGLRHGAFFTDKELGGQPVGGAVEEKPFAERTDQELIDWIMEERPSVEATVAAAGDDAHLAQRVLDAESAATAGEPRQEVVDGLRGVLGG